ncbi:hypothetical protein PHYBOEH_005641 [Phytophthora boehmeriae]|uniref:RxLR effector protein n=1 Tax=Phytophthora boehmeriae TaxID=109152 RepID=A0A8T1WP66_9STRA|nr:hypothetical protein PHYBOEH_005641 [Phytophthora boehmeriae]
MRPSYILLLTLAFLIALTNAVLADNRVSVNSLTAVNNESNNKRSLRIAEQAKEDDDDEEEEDGEVEDDADDDDDDEERLLGLGKLSEKYKLMKMRRSAKKDMKAADKLKAAEAAKLKKAEDAAAKLKAREDKMINGWLGELRRPDKVYKDLGLLKLGNRATESKNYRIYEDYLAKYYQRVDNFGR